MAAAAVAERAARPGPEPARELLVVDNIEVVYDHVILVLKGVSLAVPQGGTNVPLNETQLAQYMEILAKLRAKMITALEQQPDASVNVVAIELKNAMLETEALLVPTDEMARRTLRPLLLPPLNVGGQIPLPPATGDGGS